MPDTVAVHVKDCEFHEEGHSVLLLPTISLDGGIAAEQDLFASNGDDQLLIRKWMATFVRYGAVGWDLCRDGKSIPFSLDTLLADYAIARPVAEKASDLYSPAVMAPFLPASDKPSPTGPTPATTSPRRRRSPSPSE